ncbi:MAG: ATP-binding protein [Bacteroidota bacterium]
MRSFVWATSHDLKEPLRTIGSFAGLLQKKHSDQLDKDGQDYLHFMMAGVKKMSQLLKDLLSYAVVFEQGKIPRWQVDMQAVAQKAIKFMDEDIQANRVRLQVGQLPVVKANPAMMCQLMQNLLSNAIRFNDKEHIRIDIDYTDKGDTYHFFIKDNGIGIEQKYQGKIFTSFQRLNPGLHDGSGLGLSICKEIVEKHSGKLWLHSQPGAGSTFFFSIPKDH